MRASDLPTIRNQSRSERQSLHMAPVREELLPSGSDGSSDTNARCHAAIRRTVSAWRFNSSDELAIEDGRALDVEPAEDRQLDNKLAAMTTRPMSPRRTRVRRGGVRQYDGDDGDEQQRQALSVRRLEVGIRA